MTGANALTYFQSLSPERRERVRAELLALAEQAVLPESFRLEALERVELEAA